MQDGSERNSAVFGAVAITPATSEMPLEVAPPRTKSQYPGLIHRYVEMQKCFDACKQFLILSALHGICLAG
jgi:hypothetical protein